MPAFAKNKRNLLILGGMLVFFLLAASYFLLTQTKETETSQSATTQTSTNNSDVQNTPAEQVSDVRWENTSEGGWMALGVPPKCPEPFTLQSPTEISKVTSILYPGQTRGGDYKPHGGFRFDNLKPDQASTTSPITGYVYRGARYLVEGELQYTFDIIHPCGFMVRVGHLLTLTPTFQAIADKFPAAVEGGSQTQKDLSYTQVKAGDTIATAVGLTKGSNTFFDFGVYDLRTQNEASKDFAYQQAHSDEKEQAFYAICWFDLLPSTDTQKVKGLPAADGASGKTSDYCK